MSKYFRVSIAGKNIEIECFEKTAFRQSKNYLSDFATPDFRITIPMEELEAAAAELPPIKEHYKGVATTLFYGDIESKLIQQKVADALLSYDTLLMHGSVVARDGYSYMFTAPSGIGKTTRTRLFLELYPDSVVVNGDKPFIQIDDTRAVACGSPWCGKEGWNTNIMVPLQAIFLLERVQEGEADSIEEVSLGKAFPFILQQTYRPENPVLARKTMSLLQSLAGKVKIYRFCSNPTQESVKLAYETAKPK